MSDAPDADPVATGPEHTVASGQAFGLSWVLTAYETDEGVCMEVDFSSVGFHGSGAGCGFGVEGELAGQPVGETVPFSWNVTCPGYDDATGAFIFGPVVRDVTGLKVTLATADNEVIFADVLPGPPDMGVDFFFAKAGRCVEVQQLAEAA